MALSVALSAGLGGWALTPLALAAQARQLRAFPGLALRVDRDSALKLSMRAFLLQAGATIPIGLLVDTPWLVTVLALAFGAWLAARRTLFVDLVRVRLAVRDLERGRLERAVRAAVAIVRSCRRHGFGMGLAHVARGLAMTVDAMVGPEEALRVLEPIAGATFKIDTLDWSLALQRVTLLVALGRCDDARSVLSYCEATWPPPTDALREDRDVLTARVDAATGAHAGVLERAADRTGVGWDLVRAHAHAAGGDRTKARAALECVLAAEHGPEVLAIVAARSGPAAEIARVMLAGGNPYRS